MIKAFGTRAGSRIHHAVLESIKTEFGPALMETKRNVEDAIAWRKIIMRELTMVIQNCQKPILKQNPLPSVYAFHVSFRRKYAFLCTAAVSCSNVAFSEKNSNSSSLSAPSRRRCRFSESANLSYRGQGSCVILCIHQTQNFVRKSLLPRAFYLFISRC